ncbi:hypothetical protein GCM10010289_73180 [Streptomyces violascens]|nr:hypothetical protein GCM10010289_73180 [Streptomyces violascens]
MHASIRAPERGGVVMMRTVPLVGGPVELRGALDLEKTPAGVMPGRLPAWTKEQYQDPSVYGGDGDAFGGAAGVPHRCE